jgi:hypothetical protein
MTEADESSHLREQLREALHQNNLQRVRINMLEVALEHYVSNYPEGCAIGCVHCKAALRLVDQGREERYG